MFVIPPMGDGRKNLRTRFERIIGRAGLTPWPKLFQNLRSTCETELCENFPLHVVTKWLGNSEQIAKKHYLQVTDEHFERATLSEVVQNPMQIPMQSEAIRTLPELAGDCPEKDKTPQNELFCGVVMPWDEAGKMALMGGEGLEQPPLSSLKTACLPQSGAQNGARPENGAATGGTGADALVAGLAHTLATDADLRRLSAVWGRLSPDDRQAMASHAETLAAARGPSQRSRTGKAASKPTSAR